MLAGATRWLAARSAVTLLAARRANHFAAGECRFLPLDVDWNSASFHSVVETAIRAAPPIETALLWLHDPAEVMPRLLPMLGTASVVLVLGCGDGRPDVPTTAARVAMVRLGSMPTATGRRWLTHAEISAGAIAALEDGQSRIVGELVPLR